jgi:type I restriction enzyme S subunit
MSATELRRVKLKDVCDRITVGHVGPMADKYTADGVPFLRSQNIAPFRLNVEDIKYVPREFHEKLRKSALHPGDVAVVRTGYPGTACVIPKTFKELNCADLVVITPSSELNPHYLAAIFNSAWGMASVAGNLVGVAQQHFNVGAAKELVVGLPPKPTQDRIAGILSAYDELIENSQRRIKILESMARALYREWFVHFRFPGHENHSRVTSPLGEIPQGWRVKTVKEILARRPAGSVYRDADVKPEGDVPVIDQSTSELLGFHDNAPDHIASSALPMAIFGDHTCKMQLLIEPFSVGPNVVPFLASNEMPTSYVFYAVNSLVQTQEYKRHWIPLTAKEVVISDRATAQEFASLIKPMLVTQETLRKAIRNLRRTRDLLLPRLLSGQIDLNAVDSIESLATA